MNGPLPAHFGRLLGQLLGDREIADYSVTADITPDAAREAAARTLEFLEGTLPLLAQRAPETAGVMPDLSGLRAVVEESP